MKRLTAKLVDAINRPGKYHDGDAGLYLYVQESNGRLRKSYVQRVTVHGTHRSNEPDRQYPIVQ